MPSSDADPCGHEQPADVVGYTRTGKPVTGADLEEWAAEAEQGYDPDQLVSRNVVPEVHYVHDDDNVSGNA